MSYIVVWRNNTKAAFIETDTYGFIETYDSFETAKKSADETVEIENENSKSEWYFNYKIYKEC